MCKKANINDLLAKPLWQMTGEEYVALHAYATKMSGDEGTDEPHTRITGVRPLAEFCGCCESTIYMLMRNRVLDSAILSRIGKRIVFNGEVARRCADEYQKRQRANRADMD